MLSMNYLENDVTMLGILRGYHLGFRVSLKSMDRCPYKRKAIGDLKSRRIRAESHVKEAEMGVMSLQAKECQGL